MADTAPARRHFIVETDASGVYLDREHSISLFADLEALLATVGGVITIAAQRTKLEEMAGDPVAVTSRLVIEWRAHSPLSMIDPGGVEEEREPAPAPALEGEFTADELEPELAEA